MSHLQIFRESMKKSLADAAIVSDKLNQRYLTGFDFEDGMLLVTAKKAYLLTDFRYLEAARAQVSAEWEILTPDCGRMPALHGLLSEDGCRRVLIEEQAVSVEAFSNFKKKLQEFEILSGASALLTAQRRIKEDEELETIAAAQAITDKAFAHILAWMTPEMTERDVALELEFFMRKQGAESVAFDTIAVSGSNSAKPHGVPRPVRLERGFLTMDFGAKYRGYCSDMTRTVVIGRADEEMKKVYQTVLSAQKAALEQVAEGVSCRALDGIARKIIYDAGYEGCFGHSLGHGVGMYIHENPSLSPAAPENLLLERGNVVTIEPGIYLSGTYGCRIEDMVCIRQNGTMLDFTDSPKELIELF